MNKRGGGQVDNNYKFRRLFLIFNKEDAGFNEGGDPEGYLKLEVRDGNGKLNCHVSNLKEESSNMKYMLYIMKLDETTVVPCLAGSIAIKKNKGELNWEFDPLNVGRTGLTIDEFNAAIVLVQYKNRPYDSIISPLAALGSKKTEWRGKLERYFKEKESDDGNNNKPQDDNLIINIKENITSRYENSIESKFTGYSSLSAPDAALKVEKDDETDDRESAREEKKNTDSKDGINLTEQNNDNCNECDQSVQSDIKQDGQEVNPGDNMKLSTASIEETSDRAGTNNAADRGILDTKSESQVGCETGIANIEVIAERFDKFFIKNNPFMTTRKDYKWWKVASPVHLNNILYQLNIKVPVLFNPQVLMAHFKYRHLIVGTYKGEDGTEFIVCGIPSVYWVDEKPFANLCRWAQVEGNTPKYGAFGYWLVYVDPKSGKILSAG